MKAGGEEHGGSVRVQLLVPALGGEKNHYRPAHLRNSIVFGRWMLFRSVISATTQLKVAVLYPRTAALAKGHLLSAKMIPQLSMSRARLMCQTLKGSQIPTFLRVLFITNDDSDLLRPYEPEKAKQLLKD